MKKTASLIIGLLFILSAVTPLLAEDTVHIVKKGDTLWDITKQYVENPWKWPIIWSNNQDITNPHRIFPGDQVIISRTGDKTTITIIPDGKEPATYTPAEVAVVKDKSILISPQFSTYMFSPNILTGSGSVIQKDDLGRLASKNEAVIIKSNKGLALNHGITIVSLVSEIKNENKVVGYLYKAVAIASIEEAQSDIYKAMIAYSNQEIRAGDIILDDLKSIAPMRITPSEPVIKEPGRVIDIFGGLSDGSYLDLIFLNLGKNDGVDQGSLVSIYKETRLDDDDNNKVAMKGYQGMALVLQSLDNISMALVTDSKDAIKRGFIVTGR